MRIDRRFLGWGVFFILVGAIPLAVRYGYLDRVAVADWWSLWPLILVGIGLGLVLSRTPLELLGGLIVAATLGTIVGAALATGSGGFAAGACGNAPGVARQPQTGSFAGPASVTLRLDCGSLTVGSAPGAGWAVGGSGDPDRPPAVDASANSLTVRRTSGNGPFGGAREDWHVTLPESVATTLTVHLDAGDAKIRPRAGTVDALDVQVNAGRLVADLGALERVGSLQLQANAGELAVTLPNASTSGSIQANLGAVKLCTPSGLGLRITAGGGLGANDFGSHGLVQNGNVWTTPGYDTAQTKADLQVQANLGSISLDPEDACGE
jgi:hypothetical protein